VRAVKPKLERFSAVEGLNPGVTGPARFGGANVLALARRERVVLLSWLRWSQRHGRTLCRSAGPAALDGRTSGKPGVLLCAAGRWRWLAGGGGRGVRVARRDAGHVALNQFRQPPHADTELAEQAGPGGDGENRRGRGGQRGEEKEGERGDLADDRQPEDQHGAGRLPRQLPRRRLRVAMTAISSNGMTVAAVA
jgi:hypothetical protein